MSRYAIVETGSKQYRVEPKDIIEVEKIKVPDGQKEVVLEKVLFAEDDGKIHIGTPWLKKAKIICELLGNFRDKKVISFKYRRRKASRRKRGHRQELSKLLVKEISL